MMQSILVVDDDKQLRNLYRMALEREGYRVTEAANGADALRHVMSHTPDLILMDMLMPMLGGEAVMTRLRQMPALRESRIIVLTAYPRFREVAAFLNVDAFIVKPATPRDVVAAVRAVLAGEDIPFESPSEEPLPDDDAGAEPSDAP
jgi:CheY-like chemotaxis protein